MKAFQVKSDKLAGTDFKEVSKKAHRILHDIESKSRRKPYIRSAYFNKEKIFFDYFWTHLNQKPKRERQMRLVYLPCAIELITKSRIEPTKKANPNKKSEVLYRFTGITPSQDIFLVQIKEERKVGHKFLMSVFPFD